MDKLTNFSYLGVRGSGVGISTPSTLLHGSIIAVAARQAAEIPKLGNPSV